MNDHYTRGRNDDIGVAVVGSGAWGRNHVRVWNELGNLRAVCDPNEDRLLALRSEDPRIRTFPSIDGALELDGVDAVVIATPAVTHAELSIRALEAGKDVLVEKPMALEVADAEKVKVVAERTHRVFGVGHVLEYHPAVLRLRELVSSGALGEIRYLYSHRLNLGRVRTEENALWSFAPHDVALILRILGMLPNEVACRGGAYLSEEVADVTLMSLGFETDVMAHVFVSWLHPFKVQRFVVVGSEQMAEFDDTAPWDQKLRLFPHTVELKTDEPPIARKAEAVPVALVPKEPLRAECEHFLASVAFRRTPLTDAASGIDVLRVLGQAQSSLELRGTPQALP